MRFYSLSITKSINLLYANFIGASLWKRAVRWQITVTHERIINVNRRLNRQAEAGSQFSEHKQRTKRRRKSPSSRVKSFDLVLLLVFSSFGTKPYFVDVVSDIISIAQLPRLLSPILVKVDRFSSKPFHTPMRFPPCWIDLPVPPSLTMTAT